MEKADRTAWKGVLVWLETNDSGLTPLSRETAALALELARSAGVEAAAVILESKTPLRTYENFLTPYPFPRCYVCRGERLKNFQAGIYAEALCEIIEEFCPGVVIIGACDKGKDAAPMAAAKFQSGLTADCTKLAILEDGNLLQTRPAFGGNIMAEIITPGARPQVATVRRGLSDFPIKNENRPRIIFNDFNHKKRQASFTVLETRNVPHSQPLSEAKIIVAMGCGFKSPNDIALVEKFAERIGGVPAASRGLVERGWMPHESQIGISGHTVSPELLITLGISGSVQFLAGLNKPKKIIAVNTDPAAKIFSIAHLPLLADLYEILPHLNSLI